MRSSEVLKYSRAACVSSHWCGVVGTRTLEEPVYVLGRDDISHCGIMHLTMGLFFLFSLDFVGIYILILECKREALAHSRRLTNVR